MVIVLGEGGGACCAPSLDDSIVDPIVRQSVARLQAAFDKQDKKVTCKYEILCKHAETIITKREAADNCPEGCTCTCDPFCAYNTNHNDPCPSGKCEDPYCPQSGSMTPRPACYSIDIPYNPPSGWSETCGNINGICYSFGEEHIVSFVTRISCVDSKFQSPVRTDKFENLNMSFLAHVYLTHKVDPPNPPQPKIECKT